MSDIKKLLTIFNESTTAGSVAVGAGRGKLPADTIFAAEDSDCSSIEMPNSPANFDLWKNSKLIGKQQNSHKKVAVNKTTMYPQLAEATQPEQRTLDARTNAAKRSERGETGRDPAPRNEWYIMINGRTEKDKKTYPSRPAAEKRSEDIKAFYKSKGWSRPRVEIIQQLGETYKAPKDMDDYTDDDWAEWDAKVGNVGKKAKEQDSKKAKEQDANESVTEGFGDKIKGAVKAVKRASQGWDKNAVGPGGEKLGDPRDIVNRAKSASDDSVQRLAKDKELGFPFGGDSSAGPHSPRGLQKRALDREMKKRGLGEQDVAEGSQPNDIAVYHHTGPNADKKAQVHAMKLGSDYGHFRHDKADKNDNLHIVTQKRYFPDYAKQQDVAEGLEDKVVFQGHTIGHIETDSDGDSVGIVYSNNPQSKRPFEIFGYEDVNQLKQEMISQWNKRVPKGTAKGQELSEEMIADRLKNELALFKKGSKAKDKDLGSKPKSKEVQPKKSKESKDEDK